MAAILLSVISRQTRKQATAGKNDRLRIKTAGQTRQRKKYTDSHRHPGISDPAADPADTDGEPHVADRRYDGGDREHISQENAVYTVNPLTGTAYSMGMSLRLKILCLPTLYGAISRFTGMAPVDVVYRLIPCITLLLSYVAYGSLGKALFRKIL